MNIVDVQGHYVLQRARVEQTEGIWGVLEGEIDEKCGERLTKVYEGEFKRSLLLSEY